MYPTLLVSTLLMTVPVFARTSIPASNMASEPVLNNSPAAMFSNAAEPFANAMAQIVSSLNQNKDRHAYKRTPEFDVPAMFDSIRMKINEASVPSQLEPGTHMNYARQNPGDGSFNGLLSTVIPVLGSLASTLYTLFRSIDWRSIVNVLSNIDFSAIFNLISSINYSAVGQLLQSIIAALGAINTNINSGGGSPVGAFSAAGGAMPAPAWTSSSNSNPATPLWNAAAPSSIVLENSSIAADPTETSWAGQSANPPAPGSTSLVDGNLPSQAVESVSEPVATAATN